MSVRKELISRLTSSRKLSMRAFRSSMRAFTPEICTEICTDTMPAMAIAIVARPIMPPRSHPVSSLNPPEASGSFFPAPMSAA